jgi:hypothetical protein
MARSIDAYASPDEMKNERRKQLLLDLRRNAFGLPEAAFSLGSNIVSMAGEGLGGLAGMTHDALTGAPTTFEEGLGRAREGIEEGDLAYQPRGEGAKEIMRGFGMVGEPIEKVAQFAGEKTQEATGSPFAGTAAYTALSAFDPEIMGPVAAQVQALRSAQRVARSTPTAPVRQRGFGGKQAGAWSPGDIENEPGDFTRQSTIEMALGKMKPQELKARGKQMAKVLAKYGAKKGELRWTGLDTLLEQDMPVTADDIRAHLQDYGVQVNTERFGKSAPIDDSTAPVIDPDEREAKIRDAVDSDSDLRYPMVYAVRDTDADNTIRTFSDQDEADQYLEDYRNDVAEQEADYYLQEGRDMMGAEAWDAMTPDEQQEWAQARGQESAAERSLEIEESTDFDEGPENYDELYEYWAREIDADPESWGLGRASQQKSKWEHYTLGRETGDIGQPGSDYGETVLTLGREGRQGRGTMPAEMVDVTEDMPPLRRAQIEELRRRQADPELQRAANPYRYTTHFPSTNPLVYTRESTMPAPPGATTPGTMRMAEELQSDWGQFGRKKGIQDPEAEAAERPKRIEKAKSDLSTLTDDTLKLFEQIPSDNYNRQLWRIYNPKGGDFTDTAHVRDVIGQLASEGKYDEALSVIESLNYHASNVPDVADASRTMASRTRRLQRDFGAGDSRKLPDAPFIGDAKNWGKLGLQQLIIDAVRRGDQYVGWTPGYVHGPNRWGTEDIMWSPGATPGQRRIAVAATSGRSDPTRGQWLPQRVKELEGGAQRGAYSGEPVIADFDLDAPDAQAQMESIVRDYLGYEAQYYPDSDEFISGRAKTILDDMRANESGRRAPRSHGMEAFYGGEQTSGAVGSIMQDILKGAGSTGSGRGIVTGAEAATGAPVLWERNPQTGEWRARVAQGESDARRIQQLAESDPDNYRYEPPRQHYVEIDPELARAAKRGFPLPF